MMQAAPCGDRLGISGQFREILIAYAARFPGALLLHATQSLFRDPRRSHDGIGQHGWPIAIVQSRGHQLFCRETARYYHRLFGAT
jgi:hypothetical protein